MIVKTRASLAGAVEAAVKDMHSYSKKAILVIPLESVEKTYLGWIFAVDRGGPTVNAYGFLLPALLPIAEIGEGLEVERPVRGDVAAISAASSNTFAIPRSSTPSCGSRMASFSVSPSARAASSTLVRSSSAAILATSARLVFMKSRPRCSARRNRTTMSRFFSAHFWSALTVVNCQSGTKGMTEPRLLKPAASA